MTIENEIAADDSASIQIIRMIQDLTGERPKEIDRSTDLSSDLGIAGQDGFEILEKLNKRFGLKYSEKEMSDYFGDEGFSLFSIFFDMLKKRPDPSEFQRLEYAETRLEVGDIIDAIKNRTVLIPKTTQRPYKLKPEG